MKTSHHQARLICTVILAAGCAAGPVSAGVVDTSRPDFLTDALLVEAADDMNRDHAAVPNGTSSQDWSLRPRLGFGENPPAGWSSTIVWGQVYEPTSGNPATNVRVQLRNLRLAVLTKSTGTWDVLQNTSSFDGAYFREDFANDDSIAAAQRDEGESASIQLPVGAGRNYHFWSGDGRTPYDLSDIDEVVAMADARLVLDDPAGPDDRDAARLMMSIGADYWETQAAQWDNWTTNGDVGIGRFEFISSDWETFTMTTLTPGEVATLIPEPSAALLIAAPIGIWLCRRRTTPTERS
ncbi:MAG: hypothetical protein AAGL98_05595 [Planctomycetota bacterium]